MARWKTTKEITSGGSLTGGLEYDDHTSNWKVYQDEKPFLEQAKLDRELMNKKDTGYKKFATIPDIVAIEVLQNYGIDIHCPFQSSDSSVMKRFKTIIKQDYPHLLSY